MQTFGAWLGQQEALFPEAMYGLIPAIRRTALALGNGSTSPDEAWLRANAPVLTEETDDFVDFYESAIAEYTFLEAIPRAGRRRVYEFPMQLHRIQYGDRQRVFDGFAGIVSENPSTESTGWLFFEDEAPAYMFVRSARMAFHSCLSELRPAQRIQWYWPHEADLPNVPRQEAVVLLPSSIRHRDDFDMIQAYVRGLDPRDSGFAPNQGMLYELARTGRGDELHGI